MYELVQNIASDGETTVTIRGKMKFGAWLGAAMAAALHFAAPLARADVTAETAAAPVLDDRYPKAKVSFGSDVESYPDVVFSTQPGFRPLRLDIYRQVAPKGRVRWLFISMAAAGSAVTRAIPGRSRTGPACSPRWLAKVMWSRRWSIASAAKRSSRRRFRT